LHLFDDLINRKALGALRWREFLERRQELRDFILGDED
jgi:hypothetical protein